MKKIFCIFLCLTLVLGVTGCAKADTRTTTASETPAAAEQTTLQAETEVMLTEPVTATEQATTEVATGQSIDYQSTKDFEMILLINDVEIPVFWESCTAVDELMTEISNGSITVSMSMYGGWEQVGSLGRSYTRDDRQMTAVNGDIVLYSGNQIVVFYGSNSWSYTKLGKMDLSADEVTALLSQRDITLTITK